MLFGIKMTANNISNLLEIFTERNRRYSIEKIAFYIIIIIKNFKKYFRIFKKYCQVVSFEK